MNIRFFPSTRWLAPCVLYLLITAAARMDALQPPAPGELARYRADGTYAARLEAARMFGNYRVKPWLAQRTVARLQALAGQTTLAPPPAWQGLPTTGTNNVLILCISFPDYAKTVAYQTTSNMVFGAGNSANYPLESLQRYYQRSSYGKLTIEGNILEYACTNNRSFYKPDGAAYDNYANYLIIKEAVDYFDARGHDFSQYDNNHDGTIDYFAVFWTGPVGNWATFWWGYQWSLYTALVKDGVSFGDFSWQWESSSPSVVIHETGHALGVPDFYDYSSTVGPKGGVGGLDIMDGVKGDHNAFSKFMLEWLTPTIVTTNLTAYPQRASAQYPDAVLIAPAITNPAQIYSEYFIMQNRYRTLNDAAMPGNGLLIWHVDARLSGGGFLYDNSYTAHKLLRLMEADGLEQIEQGTGGNAGDYYTTTRSFGPATRPGSARYDGTPTLATVSAISANALSMRADVGFARPRIGLSTTTLLLSATGAGSDSQMLMVTNRGTGPLELALQTQGPYSARDTSMSNGPTFAWIDIASSGTAVTPLSDDGNAGPYPLGFSLPLYNSCYSQFYVSMNGGITFANATLNYNNTTLPTANPDTAFIAAMWDDLNPGGGGSIRYAIVGGKLVVSFLNVPHYGDASSSNTFQIILQSNGTMVLQYKAASSISSPATLGLQGQGGSTAPALQIAYSTNYIRPNLAVQIDARSLLPSWLTCAPTVGTVPASASLPLTFTASAAGLTNGIYTHTLTLTHNDIEQPTRAIALTFVVPEPGVFWLLGAGLWLLRKKNAPCSCLL